MAETTRQVKGFAEIAKFFDEVTPKMGRSIMRGSMRDGAKVMQEAAQANLVRNKSVKHGDLYRSIKVGSSQKGSEIHGYVRTRDFRATWVEKGTVAHQIVAPAGKFLSVGGFFFKFVNHPGADPKPFMRPAVDKYNQQAVQAMGKSLRARFTTKGLNTAHIMMEGDE